MSVHGPGATRGGEFYARAGVFLAPLNPAGPIPVIVTHGGMVYAMVAHWLRLAPEQMKAVNFGAHVTSVTILRMWNGLRDVERLNDIGHLTGTESYPGAGPG